MKATPWGFRDILPEEAQVREEIADTVKACFKRHGYLPIETPLLEDKGSITQGGRSADDTPFKLFDDDGRLLVVRPDNTLSIVRLVSTRMHAAPLPLRLRYDAPVVREQARYAGVSRQFTQLGFELIGEEGSSGDAELVRMVVDTMWALGISSWRVVCGSVRPFLELLSRCDDEELAREALSRVHANNLVDLDTVVRAAAISDAMKRAICEVPRTFGGVEALDRIDDLLQEAGIEEQLTGELRSLARAYGEPSADSSLTFDFSILNSFDYYTGLVLKVYAGDLPDPVGSGGRYDAIFDGVFPGREHTPAAGFAFSLERLESACQARSEQRDASADHAVARTAQEPLRIAVPKGSLNAGTIEALETIGLDVGALRDPGRHLIVSSRDERGEANGFDIGSVEFVIVRASDAPAFVAGGGADCGFCGRDSLIEANLNLLELLDMLHRSGAGRPRRPGGPRLCASRLPARGDQVSAHRGGMVRAARYRGGYRVAPRQHRARAHRGHDRPHRGHHGHGHDPPREQPGHHRRDHGVHGALLREPRPCSSGRPGSRAHAAPRNLCGSGCLAPLQELFDLGARGDRLLRARLCYRERRGAGGELQRVFKRHVLYACCCERTHEGIARRRGVHSVNPASVDVNDAFLAKRHRAVLAEGNHDAVRPRAASSRIARSQEALSLGSMPAMRAHSVSLRHTKSMLGHTSAGISCAGAGLNIVTRPCSRACLSRA